MTEETDSVGEGAPDLLEAGYASVGDRLRAVREAKRLELADIAAETRIPMRHLATIEAGALEDLPSRAYAIGFARSYAGMLGLDQDEIIAAVREELADGGARQPAMVGGMEPGDASKLPSRKLAWFGVMAAVVLALGAFTFFGGMYGAGAGLPALTGDTQADIADAATDSGAAASGVDAMPINPPSADGQVVFTALEDGIWVRFFEAGGNALYEAQMVSGESFALPLDASEPRINTGRPDALAITIGGQSVPKLAEQPTTMGNTPISAAALLARADQPGDAVPVNN